MEIGEVGRVGIKDSNSILGTGTGSAVGTNKWPKDGGAGNRSGGQNRLKVRNICTVSGAVVLVMQTINEVDDAAT